MKTSWADWLKIVRWRHKGYWPFAAAYFLVTMPFRRKKPEDPTRVRLFVDDREVI